MAWNGQRIRVWKKMPLDENYYGLGDKAGPMNRRNRAFTNWNTDEFGWQESTDPLYKTIPFFIGLRKGLAYGVFFDNTYRSVFDFGKESPDFFSFGAEGGELNYYFIAGPEPKKIIEEYTAMTDAPRCLPSGRWATSKAVIRTIRNRARGRSSKHCAKRKYPRTPSTSTSIISRAMPLSRSTGNTSRLSRK